MAAKHPAISAEISQALSVMPLGTETRIAEKLGVSQSTVNRWATGQSSPHKHLWPAVEKVLKLKRGRLADAANGGEPEVIDPASQPDDELRRRIESLERELTNQTAALAALAHGVAENRAKANNAAAAMLDRLTRLEQTVGP